MFETISIIVIAAGLCSGAIVGAAIATETEQNRSRTKPWVPFSQIFIGSASFLINYFGVSS